MIYKLFVAFVFLSLLSAKSQAQDQPGQSASHSVIKFYETTYDFGDKPLGASILHKFAFKNVSKQRIAIREVKTSCGCTTPEYSTDPIKPGRKGSVTAKYDGSHPGPYEKTLTVKINDGEEIILTIKGNMKSIPAGYALPR